MISILLLLNSNIVNKHLKMIKSLGDYKKDDKKEKKKKTTAYAGGEKSGMAVENPMG